MSDNVNKVEYNGSTFTGAKLSAEGKPVCAECGGSSCTRVMHIDFDKSYQDSLVCSDCSNVIIRVTPRKGDFYGN